MSELDLPPRDDKYKNFVEGELVVLIDAVNDIDFTRIYEVKSDYKDGKIDVMAVTEEPKSKKHTKTFVDEEVVSLKNRVFHDMDAYAFQSYN